MPLAPSKGTFTFSKILQWCVEAVRDKSGGLHSFSFNSTNSLVDILNTPKRLTPGWHFMRSSVNFLGGNFMNMKTRKLVMTGMLCALAYAMTVVGRVPIVFFLKYDPKDIVIAGNFTLP